MPFEATLQGAARAGQRVGDYIEAQHDCPGSSQATIDWMSHLGVFARPIERVCEIGPGSGRYLEKTLALCPAAHYQIYETAEPWAEWLVRTYDVVRRPVLEATLAATDSDSIDLVQAHKVFVVTPSLYTCSYLREMARVVRHGGHVVFDVVTEQCFDSGTLDRWLSRPLRHHIYPAMMPRQFVIDLLGERGLELRGTFIGSMSPGVTECMVFARQGR